MRTARTSAFALVALLALLAPGEAIATGRASEPVRAPRAVDALTLELSKELVPAGETAVVFVVAVDERGRPTDVSVSLECDFVELEALVRVSEGLYRATLTAPKVLPQRRMAMLFARSGGAHSELVVPLGPAAAAEVKLDGPDEVIADGKSRARLEISVEDAYGNAAADVPRLSAKRGELLGAERIDTGLWTVEYLPSRTLENDEDVLSVEVGDLKREHAIRLTTRRTWMAVSPWMGMALGSGGSALALGASASGWRRRGVGQVGLVLDAAWWRLAERSPLALPGGAVELDGERSYLPATLSLGWGRRLGRRAFATLSAGGGAARVTSGQKLGGQPGVSEVGWSPSVTGAVALGMSAWGGTPYLEVRALWIGDPGLATLRGSTHPIFVIAGYRFDAR